jgi:hypothetical protein
MGVLGGFFTLLVAGVLRGATGAAGGTGSRQACATSLAQDQPRRQRNDEKQHERDADDTQ